MASPLVYRITVFFKRRPDLTEEQFYHHWRNIHGPLVIPWALHYGLIGYTQFQTPSGMRKLLGDGMNPDFNAPLEFDAAADWFVTDMDTYNKSYADPYYADVIKKDEDRFIDKEKTKVVKALSAIGTSKEMIKDGKPMVEVNDRLWKEYQRRMN